MAIKPPFMNAYGLLSKILEKIIEAKKPDRFTQDFLATKLGFSGSSARAAIPLLKRTSFLKSDGSPTDLYSKFRNASERGSAMATAMRVGYKDIFERNEYAQDLSKDKLTNLLVEITGLEKKASSIKSIVGTFNTLKVYANFETHPVVLTAKEEKNSAVEDAPTMDKPLQVFGGGEPKGVGLNLSYTINLNLPETTDIEVFNAIFKSLKENLLEE